MSDPEDGDRVSPKPRRVCRTVTAVLLASLLGCRSTQPKARPDVDEERVLIGAGAPLFDDRELMEGVDGEPVVAIRYDYVGSDAALEVFGSGSLDFACVDMPVQYWPGAADLAPDSTLEIPIAGWMVSIRHSVPGVGSQLVLSSDVLAAIYVGEIRRWSDPAIKRLNPTLKLPDCVVRPLRYTRVRPGENRWSAETLLFASYLAVASHRWREAVGSSPRPVWPCGRERSLFLSGDIVAESEGSLVPGRWPQRPNECLIRNANGRDVAASAESGYAALRSLESRIEREPDASTINTAGETAYPIVGISYIVVPRHVSSGSRRARLCTLARQLLGPAQEILRATSNDVGWLALPERLRLRSLSIVERWERGD